MLDGPDSFRRAKEFPRRLSLRIRLSSDGLATSFFNRTFFALQFLQPFGPIDPHPAALFLPAEVSLSRDPQLPDRLPDLQTLAEKHFAFRQLVDDLFRREPFPSIESPFLQVFSYLA